MFASFFSSLSLAVASGSAFLMIAGIWVTQTFFAKNVMEKDRYVLIILLNFIYLLLWASFGFHLTHNVFTGQPTVYLNDPSTNGFEIISWIFLVGLMARFVNPKLSKPKEILAK
jgi:hypothetical protein